MLTQTKNIHLRYLLLIFVFFLISANRYLFSTECRPKLCL